MSRTTVIGARVRPWTRDLVEIAAAERGETISAFVERAIRRAALFDPVGPERPAAAADEQEAC